MASYGSRLSLLFFLWFLLFVISLLILTTNEEQAEHMSMFWPVYAVTAGLSVIAFALGIAACKNLLVSFRRLADLQLAGELEEEGHAAPPSIHEQLSSRYQESLISRSSLVNSSRRKDSDDVRANRSPRLLQRFEFRRSARSISSEAFGGVFLGSRAAYGESGSAVHSPHAYQTRSYLVPVPPATHEDQHVEATSSAFQYREEEMLFTERSVDMTQYE